MAAANRMKGIQAGSIQPLSRLHFHYADSALVIWGALMIERLVENAAQFLLLLMLSPLVTGVIRTLKARLQTRRGPGILQPYKDCKSSSEKAW